MLLEIALLSLSICLSFSLFLSLFYIFLCCVAGEDSGAVVVDEAHKEAKVEAVESVKRELTPTEFHQYCKKVGILTSKSSLCFLFGYK